MSKFWTFSTWLSVCSYIWHLKKMHADHEVIQAELQLRWFHFEFWFYQHTSCFSKMFHKVQTTCIRNLLHSNDMRACAAQGIPDQNYTWLHQVKTVVHCAQLRDRAGPRTVLCVGDHARAADVTVFVIGTYFPGFRTEWSAIIYLYFAFSHHRTDLYYFFTVA
jgi:hypothetical protein